MSDWKIPGPLRLFAPAKINLGLEVCERRPDGFHDVVTIMETVSVFDIIDVTPADSLNVISDHRIAAREDLVVRALRALEEITGATLGLRVETRKHIPISAGLGGGSSDAGTVINALGELMGLSEDELHNLAARLGSDIPFLLHGGTALATGTGTEVEPLQSIGRRWYLIVTPQLEIPGKTATLYSALRGKDFTDGERTRTLARALSSGSDRLDAFMGNVFQRALIDYPAFRSAFESLQSAGAATILASGAGPSVYAVCATYHEAKKLRGLLQLPAEARAFIATSIGPDVNRSRIGELVRPAGAT